VEVLARQLTERGYSVKANVGIARLYVDLAVIDPTSTNRYVPGIVVDGGGLLSDLMTASLKVGGAVLVAEKGKGLEAAIDALGDGDKKKETKPEKT